MKTRKGQIRRWMAAALGAVMLFGGALPAQAASKYGEEKAMRSVRTGTVNVGNGHKHTYIEANNGVRYFLYDSCMNGLTGTTPTNHSSTVTIDGVKYTLRNYNKGSSTKWANVIKKAGGTSTASAAQKKIALTGISLNKTTASLTAGNTLTLSVTYKPANTTDSKTVKWSTSNSTVASVSGGKVTGKKAGTATITAKVGTKSASCRVTVKAKASSTDGIVVTVVDRYKNVSDAYTYFNRFRTSSANQWYWNNANTAKVKTGTLKALKRDAALEKVAEARAKEQWTQYYVYHRTTHDRLNGSNCWTAYPADSKPAAENLSWGRTTSYDVIYNGWAETSKNYSGQGHRRNMLKSGVTRVGIACYEKDGKTCWAMCIGY